MRVAVLGGSGLIGRALCAELIRGKHDVRVISRTPDTVKILPGVDVVGWSDGARGLTQALDGMDGVINLAGASIGAWRWTGKRKQAILESRLSAGRAIVAAFQSDRRTAKVLIQSSAVGYYGALDDREVEEGDAPGKDFLASVAVKWENATQETETLGVRRAVIRSGVVLTREGGVLPLMALPVQFFTGGPLGGGKQWLSWIHNLDEVRAIRFLLENPDCAGVYNLCAPNAVQQGNFSRILARTIHRPHWLPLPGFVLRVVLGEMSTLVLDGQRVFPRRLTEAGFQFQFPELGGALVDLFEPH